MLQEIIPDNVTVIRDARDATKDYVISRASAEARFDRGELCQIELNSGWTYAEQNSQ